MTAASWRRRLPSSRRSLVARLVLTFLILSVVMVGVVGTVSYIRARDALRDSAFARLETAADQKADSLDRWVDEQRRSVVFTAGLLGGYYGHQNTTSAVRTGRASELLDDRATAAERRQAHRSVVDTLGYVVSQTADAEEFLVLDLQGKVVASTAEEHEGVSQTTEAYFDRGGSGTYVQPVQTSNLTGEPTIAIGTPLFDPEGQRIGVVAVFLNLERVDRIVVQGTGLGESGETYVVGANRRFLHSSFGAPAGKAPCVNRHQSRARRERRARPVRELPGYTGHRRVPLAPGDRRCARSGAEPERSTRARANARVHDRRHRARGGGAAGSCHLRRVPSHRTPDPRDHGDGERRRRWRPQPRGAGVDGGRGRRAGWCVQRHDRAASSERRDPRAARRGTHSRARRCARRAARGRAQVSRARRGATAGRLHGPAGPERRDGRYPRLHEPEGGADLRLPGRRLAGDRILRVGSP